jgi:hypothetical protein
MRLSKLPCNSVWPIMILLLSSQPSIASEPALQAPGVHTQLGGLGGMAAGKLLQEFHLPNSPADLIEFILEYALRQKIGNTLPLNLNASNTFNTVESSQLPGGPFLGRPLPITAAALRTALEPGDYVVPVMAYCTQYSVHRAGQGTAYKLAPIEGTQAEAISNLLWRGTLAGKRPQELQATNWAIQSGLIYGKMPKPYQALVDELIPDFRDKLKGNMLEVIQTTYNDVTQDPRKFLQAYIKERYNKTLPLMLLPKISVPAPPLDVVLAKMGPLGHTVLDARKQSEIFRTAYETKERGEQTLFEGQGAQLPPEPASEGPWTVRIPGQIYMRFIVKSGNMAADNLMQIRVVANTASTTTQNQQHLTLASYSLEPRQLSSNVPTTSVYGLLGVKTMGDSGADVASLQALTSTGVIGYSVGGGGAQALMPTTPAPQPARKPTATITVLIHNPVIYQDELQPKETKPAAVTGLCMYLGAKINDPDHVYTRYRWLQKLDILNLEKNRSFYDTYTEHIPLNSPPSEELWYRPPTAAYDSIWQQAANGLGYDMLYRDEPSRRFKDDTRDWQAVTELLGVKPDGTFDESAALATVSWGFKKGPSGPLTPSPVEINGAVWLGTPAIKGLQAKYLCDHDFIKAYEEKQYKGTSNPKDTNWPLLPVSPLPSYAPTVLYRFVP